ncbi:MAG: hypothetical protein Q3979_01700 [Actinomycetaceae bacterium]|nr:hypothetical protein [Actinomycetaceae bacterium]
MPCWIRSCAAIAALPLFILSACSKGSATDSPSFEGPWAQEMKKAYEETTSDFAREVLARGEITGDDMSRAQKDASSCLRAKGFAKVGFDDNGVVSYVAPKDRDEAAIDEDISSCQATSGYDVLSHLYFQIRSNPDNEEWEELVVRCLRARGAVGGSFDVDDYATLLEAGGRQAVDEEALSECETDPLGVD